MAFNNLLSAYHNIAVDGTQHVLPMLNSDTTECPSPPSPLPFTEPFPFLRLPKPIRRQIYELLPAKVKYRPGYLTPCAERKPVVILVLRYIERSITQTCHQLSEEAEQVLEIETMKLGSPQMIVRGEHFYLVPKLLDDMRDTMDNYTYQRLRLSDADRANLSRTSINRLIWTRMATLSLLSRKRVQIGLWVGHNMYSVGFLDMLRRFVTNIVEPRWWGESAVIARPRFEVWIQLEEELMGESYARKQAWQCLAREGMKVVDERGDWVGEWGVRQLGAFFSS